MPFAYAPSSKILEGFWGLEVFVRRKQGRGSKSMIRVQAALPVMPGRWRVFQAHTSEKASRQVTDGWPRSLEGIQPIQGPVHSSGFRSRSCKTSGSRVPASSPCHPPDARGPEVSVVSQLDTPDGHPIIARPRRKITGAQQREPFHEESREFLRKLFPSSSTGRVAGC